jgi:prepilin-type N-terminal cleavage/methylation domain-containing protein
MLKVVLKKTDPRMRAFPNAHLARRRGFTLAELMVSVGVLLVLLMMVSMIFSTATQASSKATANNEICARLRTLERQLRNDFNGLQKDAFIGIWYQLTPYPDPDDPTTNEWVRTDRLVFFTAGDHSTINQVWDPATNSFNASGNQAMPISSNMARVFYGYTADSVDPTSTRGKEAKRLLARRVKLQTADFAPGTMADNPPNQFDNGTGSVDDDRDSSNGFWDANDDLYDNWEYEYKSIEDWQNTTFYPVEEYFNDAGTPNPPAYFEFGMMTEGSDVSWIARPVINPAEQKGMHMYFLDGCAEFKVQRWIEHHPFTGFKLPQSIPDLSAYNHPMNPGKLIVGWWPQEDRNTNSLPNEDIIDSGFSLLVDNPFATHVSGEPWDICEYFYAPSPAGAVDGNAFQIAGENSTWRYSSTTNPNHWLFYDDAPKAIKITVRLFDPMKRMEKGQTYTMVFRLRD